jgi:hypothetical protein
MSGTSQTPTPGHDMNRMARDNHPGTSHVAGANQTPAPMSARLQVIHDLVRSGDYHVPAAVIADRMVECMLSDLWRHKA